MAAVLTNQLFGLGLNEIRLIIADELERYRNIILNSLKSAQKFGRNLIEMC